MTITRQALTRLGRSIAFRVLVVVLALYALYHIVAAFSDRVVTDVIAEGEVRVTVSGEAVIFRDETVMSTAGNYLCSYPLQNGAKVNAASSLAELYSASGDAASLAERQVMLSLLDRQIAQAKAQPTNDTTAALPSLWQEVRDELIDTTRDVTDGAPMNRVSDGSFSLLLSLGRIGALTGETSGDTLASLGAARQSLLGGYAARIVSVPDVATDAKGGYFYHGTAVDGYEDVFRRERLENMQLSDFDDMMAQPRRDYGTGVTLIGKLARDHRWSIALGLSPDEADFFTVGKSYSVAFTEEYRTALRMTVDRLVGSRAEGRIVAVLSTDVLPADFSFTRFSRVEITVDTTYGYRVPETALTEQDGVEGVYILDGGRVCFRTLEVVYRGDGYVLAYAPTKAQREQEDDEKYHADRYIALRDIVITEGEDLYDGKYID